MSAALLQRWIERPDGSSELLKMPLTPEDYLHPQQGTSGCKGNGTGRNAASSQAP